MVRHDKELFHFFQRFWWCGSQIRWFLLSLDKKCTYGIKCKFYHPERANQSYLSLADELREKAQISTTKGEKCARSPPRQLHAEPEPTHKACSFPQDPEYKRDQRRSSHPSLVSENTLQYWEDLRESPNQMPHSVTGSQCLNDWPGLHQLPSHHYANISQEYLDSGLGSYESQFSDFSHCYSNSHSPRPQQQSVLPGSRQTSVHLEDNNSQFHRCCPHLAHSSALQQHHQNLDSKRQTKYNTYPPHMFQHSTPHQHSLPNQLHYHEAPNHQLNYWSDPFQGLPHTGSSCSLPSLVHSSHSHNSCCSHKDPQYQSWDQQQTSSAVFDQQRLELRKNLQAIFNPHQVDTVMNMFPHLMDAEKLAREILNLKSQGGIFWLFIFKGILFGASDMTFCVY